MSLPDAKTQILETIKLIEKHGLPFEPSFAWCILESIANGAFLAMASQANEEKLFEFIKEWSALTGLPITDEQLKTYKQRLKEAQERFKQVAAEIRKSHPIPGIQGELTKEESKKE